MDRTARQSGDEPRYPVGAVDRALKLLLMFQDRPSLRIVDAARELGTAPSTVHRLLAMLVAYGLVDRDPESQAYVPGDVLVDLGVRAVHQWDFVDPARTHIAELVHRLGETANIGVLQGNKVLVLAEVESHEMVRIGNQLGRRIPAYHSSMGRVLLADLPPDRVRQLYPDAQLNDPSDEVVVSRAELESDLKRIRATGYATNDEPRSLGFASVAVPLRRGGRTIAALATAAPLSRIEAEWDVRARQELLQTAAAIEADLRR